MNEFKHEEPMNQNARRTCVVCGVSFDMIFSRHYVARDVTAGASSLKMFFTAEPEQYDAMDCPICGCQNILQKRKQILPGFFGYDEDLDGGYDDEEDEDLDDDDDDDEEICLLREDEDHGCKHCAAPNCELRLHPFVPHDSEEDEDDDDDGHGVDLGEICV